MSVRITANGIVYNDLTGTVSAGTIKKFTGGIYNAVWNDYVDAIPVNEDADIEPGYAYAFDGEKYHKTTKYLDSQFIGFDSDTYGQGIGFREGKQLHIPVAGFILAYVDKEYPTGTPLTCTEGGLLTKIKKEDKITSPELIVATYWKKEDKEFITDGSKKILVNGRTWVKVK